MGVPKPTVLVADSMDSAVVALLQQDTTVVVEEVAPAQLVAKLVGVAGLLVRSRTKVTADILAKAPALKVIGRAGVGVDNIDVTAATRAGIAVVNAPAASTVAVAELTMGHLLALARSLPRAHATTASGSWEKKSLQGTELQGKTLGFVGLGRIGAAVAVRAQAFGMHTIAYDPYLATQRAAELGVAVVDLPQLLAQSDYLTIHAMLTDETRNLLDAKAFAQLKPGAAVVNCARGGIIDERAMLDALDGGRLRGAALDVFAQEPPTDQRLLSHPKVILSPHIGASTDEAQVVAAQVAAEGVLAVLRGKTPAHCVNASVLPRP